MTITSTRTCMVAVARVTKIRKSVDFRKYLFENWIKFEILLPQKLPAIRYVTLKLVLKSENCYGKIDTNLRILAKYWYNVHLPSVGYKVQLRQIRFQFYGNKQYI